MIRVLQKVPELTEDYIDRIVSLLKDRSHGVLITCIQLMTALLGDDKEQIEISEEVKKRFSRVVPSLVKMLRNLLNLGYSPDHDIAGIADPFLQVKLLRLLQALGHKNDEASEAMNDVLAQVATNTETNRNAGNAILYECVRAIMTVEAEAGLRVLAINILGRFLLNRDNNIRYVALNSLTKVVTEDVTAVQRHRSTILDCLKDPDVSIRQRALELTYQLVNEQNVQELVREMLNYLIVATGNDHRAHLCSRIATVVEKFSPSPKWQLEVLFAMLSIAGDYCDDSVAASTVTHVCVADTTLQAYATHKLFHLLRDELPQVQLALVHVTVWCVGEFGECLLSGCEIPAGSADDFGLVFTASTTSEKDGTKNTILTSMKRTSFEAIEVAEILGLLEAVLKSHLATVQTKSYVLTALAKLANKLPVGQAEIADLVAAYTTSMNLELQQRSCEYATLLADRWAAVRPEALARMPALDLAALAARKDTAMALSSEADFNAGVTPLSAQVQVQKEITAPNPNPNNTQNAPSLLDLDDIFGGGSTPNTAPPPPASQPTPPPASDVDLLSDIFAAQPVAPTVQAPTQPSPDLFASNQAPVSPQKAQIKAFEKDGLQVMMELSRESPNSSLLDIMCTFRNFTTKDMDRFVFQAAVPKYITMEMKPASAAVVPASNSSQVSQLIKVTNNTPKPLMMRLKIRYVVGGRQIEEQAQVNSFPPI
eukprot:CAMPEP_0197293268 /NCGR_PEP_ID=MMETSP0890-20130614/27627_1 /TAXON_ID=44058 ORGANISM="Aureoumbra lagunensis, Strain CCMP1510" /NCGR_SAMPLE_ID=MMETSP0890 /ASSEMBLY_ACC=CAM_ASM_000533 /LENGTH=710 /DNA_ID=CAMNT_0042767859 /DNA_START=439 /DNA_END=2571 /DNA_ORIENTATION=-